MLFSSPMPPFVQGSSAGCLVICSDNWWLKRVADLDPWSREESVGFVHSAPVRFSAVPPWSWRGPSNTKASRANARMTGTAGQCSGWGPLRFQACGVSGYVDDVLDREVRDGRVHEVSPRPVSHTRLQVV